MVEETEAQKAMSPLTHFGVVFPLCNPPVYDPAPEATASTRGLAQAQRSRRLDALLAMIGNLPVMNYADGDMGATR